MTFTSTIQRNHLREQRIQFIRAHQQAFDAEPIFPIQLFEEFVGSVEGDCWIEASCKIEFDKLIASRFLFFFIENLIQRSVSGIVQALNFFHQVESRLGVEINYDLLQSFIDRDRCSGTAKLVSCGIDLRSIQSESSLKMHFRLDDENPAKLGIALELIETAIALADLDSYSLNLLNIFSQFIPKNKLIPQIGFDFYLNGHSTIELYLEIKQEDLQRPEIQNILQQCFPKSVLAPLEVTDVFHIGLSQANANPVIYYRLHKHDCSIYFRFNTTAQRVHSFYQEQLTLPLMWVGVAEQELEKSKIENIRLYYHKSFALKELPNKKN